MGTAAHAHIPKAHAVLTARTTSRTRRWLAAMLAVAQEAAENLARTDAGVAVALIGEGDMNGDGR